MLLTGTAGILAGRAAIAWERVTARHIEERALREMNWRVTVNTNIDEQIVTSSAGFGARHVRFLQEGTDAGGNTIKPLLIKFDATVDFVSVPINISAEVLIGEAFNSAADREMYKNNLLAADLIFSFVTDVQIRVEGAVPVEEQLAPQVTSPSGNNSIAVGLLVGIVIGVLLIVALVALIIVLRRRHHDSKDQHGTDPTNASMQHDTNLAAMSAAAESAEAESGDTMKHQYVSEIMVSHIEDDEVSAMTFLPGLDGLTVVEDRTVSVNLDYDFLKQQRTDATEVESLATYDASQTKATEAGTSVGQTLLGLDYVEEGIDEDDFTPFSDVIKWD
jgi:hypothetical protein